MTDLKGQQDASVTGLSGLTDLTGLARTTLPYTVGTGSTGLMISTSPKF